jgi:hypothetical protein
MLRLAVELPRGWLDVSHENPGGPSTFARDGDQASGALQLSVQAEYRGGVVPNPRAEDLVAFAEGVATKGGDTEVRGRSSGRCALGLYGTVLCRVPGYSWCQVWVLSNGTDFVLATHTCVEEPSEAEVNEASWVVKNVTLTHGPRQARAFLPRRITTRCS